MLKVTLYVKPVDPNKQETEEEKEERRRAWAKSAIDQTVELFKDEPEKIPAALEELVQKIEEELNKFKSSIN